MTPAAKRTGEGRRITDEAAAAATDVAGDILGARVHDELPGASGPPDDLRQLKGVGPKFAEMLNQRGSIRFDQIAKLSHHQVEALDTAMGPFRGRFARDRIVEQADYLARGDIDGYQAKFGNL
jgi:predicted flap endonuclease-1-like 5' DNA nuclease